VQQGLTECQDEGKGDSKDANGLPQPEVRDYKDGVLRAGLLGHNGPPIGGACSKDKASFQCREAQKVLLLELHSITG
jgi:hypothetical protein